MLQRPDEASLGADASCVLQVVEEHGLRWICFKPGIQLIVTFEIEVELPPVKMTRVDRDFLRNLRPISASFQVVNNVVWVVSTTSCKEIVLGTEIHGGR